MKVVLSYHDSLICEEDLETLSEDCWINDNIITFSLEYLRHTKLSERSEILLMDPTASQLLKLIDNSSICDILDPLECRKMDWIFVVINDAISRISPGGSHWSLLVFSVRCKIAYYVDSHTGSINFDESLILLSKLFYYYNIEPISNIISLPSAQQKNGHDCGLFCIIFIEIICDMILKGDSSWKHGGLNSKHIHELVLTKRRQLIQHINELACKN